MEAPLDHCQLVISRSGVAADFHILSKQLRGLFQSLVGNSQIRQFQERFGKIGVGAERLLKQLLGTRVISLALLDVADVEQTGGVARILLEYLLKILPVFIEAPWLRIGESAECVRTRRAIRFSQC